MPEQRAPDRIEPQSPGDYLEVMSKAVFQAGRSGKVVEAKGPGTRDALRGFDAQAVAHLTPDDLDALTRDVRVIRNRRKLEAVVSNAGRILALEAEHGAFRDYLRSHGSFEATASDLRKQFKFLGEMGCYYFLYVIGEEVPPHDEWQASRRR